MTLIKNTYSILPKWLQWIDIFGVFEKDPFGNFLLVRRLLIAIIGCFTYHRYTIVNKLKIEGTEHLENLPDRQVLFLSNHQTYFADVMAMYHIFCAVKWGARNTIRPPFYLAAPKVKCYYIAAAETVSGGILPRLFSLAGAIPINRSWRSDGVNIKREFDTSAHDKINAGLQHGWVISFPQGTTKPYAPVRKGTAYLIKDLQPIVVPVVINGFRRAFDKKGLRFKKRNTLLSVTFKEPLVFAPSESIESMVQRITTAIEQDFPVDKLNWEPNSAAN